MIQQYQHVQGLYHMQQPLFIQHEQRQDHDAGHGRDIEQADFMHTEEKELHQKHSGAQVFIERFRTNPCNMQEPHAEAACRHQRNHPELPCHNHHDQAQESAEYRSNDSQQQMPACLLLRPHCFLSSWEIRFISSWGWKGFIR